MTETLLQQLRACYTLTPLDVGKFATLKASGMRFSIQAYHAHGLGHVSVMRALGFFGWMKMDTVIIHPVSKDLPLYSYDRIYAMGNDTLIVELYDTLVTTRPFPAMAKAKETAIALPERDLGEHWYDFLKLPESISKKTKCKQSADMDRLALMHFQAYLSEEAGTPEGVELQRKQALAKAYVDGLLSKGGPSTNVFKKALGYEACVQLFRTVLFGTEPLERKNDGC